MIFLWLNDLRNTASSTNFFATSKLFYDTTLIAHNLLSCLYYALYTFPNEPWPTNSKNLNFSKQVMFSNLLLFKMDLEFYYVLAAGEFVI